MAAAAAAAAALNRGGQTGCGCSWNCENFFVSDYGERLLHEYASPNPGKRGSMLAAETRAETYSACCEACRSERVPCKVFSYDPASKQCNLTSISVTPAGELRGGFGMHFVCGKCAETERKELLKQARDGPIDCNVERAELSAVGITVTRASLCIYTRASSMQRALSMPNASLLLASVHLSALTTPACVCGLRVLCCLCRCTKRRVLCCLRRCSKGRVAPCLHLCTKLLASTRHSLACVYACIFAQKRMFGAMAWLFWFCVPRGAATSCLQGRGASL